MKLQVTIFAQNLQTVGEDDDHDENEATGCHPFAVVSEKHVGGVEPTILGRTETLRNTLDPDFTKIFVVDFELGQSMNLLVSLHDSNNSNQQLGIALFDVGTVLGTKGGILGKQLKDGGYIMMHVERSSGQGTLNLHLKGLDLVSKQEQVDPYFELQKKRKTTTGKTIWDVVFRSVPVQDTSDPSWSQVSVDFGTLCDGKFNQKFRISVKDYDDSDDTLIGSCFVTVDQLLNTIMEGADDATSKDDIDIDKTIALMRPRPLREVGKIAVLAASISDREVIHNSGKALEEGEEDVETSLPPQEEEEEEDIVFEPEGDIEIVSEDLETNPTFADYVAGGCQLRAIVAIDYTASNGDPRKEDSLHHFKKDGMNTYEESIARICSVLSEYDSDQKYPVYGFGAKKGGQLSHCFPVGEEKEVDGVEGILKAYKGAFKEGIAMSKPTVITEVLQTAGNDAVSSLERATKEGHQEFTILTIFTNGNVHSIEETLAALDDLKDKPISIVVVGVGPLADMSFLNEQEAKGLRVHFVNSTECDGEALAKDTLRHVPTQLVSFFMSQGIRPNSPIEPDEIMIEPFSEETEVQTDVTVADNGDITVEDANGSAPSSASTIGGVKIPEPLAAMGGKGKSKFLAQAKRQFGRVTTQMERKMNRMIDQRVNKLFGISNVTGGKRRRNNNRR